MKRVLPVVLGLLLVPGAALAQVEVGLDAGLIVRTPDVGDNVTSISIPTGSARVGFGAGEMLSIETLLSFDRLSSGGSSFSVLQLMPGVNLSVGEAGLYVRGEVGVQRVSDETDSESQYGVGAAVGLKKPIGDGSAIFRVEGGFDKWLEDADNFIQGFNQIRVLIGFSAVIG